MSKFLAALMVVLCLSLFGAGAANAFVSPAEATFTSEDDGKRKHKHRKHRHHKHHKHHKKHGKKKDNDK